MTFPDSKKHYQVLDALRGIAAITVVIFHVFEIFSAGDHTRQIINHGYLAVDFFFVLSGFVIAHAYDDRWASMSLGGFFKRRLIRLHPMIIAGMIVGAIGFYFSASPILFPGIGQVPVWKLLLIMVIGCTLVPVPISMDIRGWAEMHPLNGPAWTLFFEYIANILYALILRRLPNIILGIMSALAAAALIHLAVTHGDVIGGWSLDAAQLRIGFTRLAYPFLAGMLLSRLVKPRPINNAFLWSTVLLLLVLALPRMGNTWQNGLYDSLSIIILFPLIVIIGAGGSPQSKTGLAFCRFLGDISYPIYITHYPFIYIFSAWVVDNNIPLSKAWPVGAGVVAASIALAWLLSKCYDIPVRKWLTKRLMEK